MDELRVQIAESGKDYQLVDLLNDFKMTNLSVKESNNYCV